MNIYEAVGLAFVIFTSLSGMATIAWFAWQGAVRLRQHLDLGRLKEDAAVRDLVEPGL